ncbi:hypothetical protein [Nonomuraea sp. NPDC049141]|uniref:hypothetical protein n=1 Tax=Nonomuraea sp. NPDC049141 TaxID=3155500 RepID=UPI0033EA5799
MTPSPSNNSETFTPTAVALLMTDPGLRWSGGSGFAEVPIKSKDVRIWTCLVGNAIKAVIVPD